MPGVSGSEPFPKGKVPNEVTAHKHLATRKEEMPEVPSAYVPSGRTTVGGIVAVAIAIPVATVAAAIAAGLGSIVFSVGFRAFFWIMKVVLSMVRIVKTGETHTPATDIQSKPGSQENQGEYERMGDRPPTDMKPDTQWLVDDVRQHGTEQDQPVVDPGSQRADLGSPGA